MERQSRQNISVSAPSFRKQSSRMREPIEKQYTVSPDYAYKSRKMTQQQLQTETNKTSTVFHDLRKCGGSDRAEIGSLRLEILQCVGLPKLDALGETDAYCIAVCESYAFRTDTIPDEANPRWLSRMRRACIFPIFDGYAKLFVGVFDADSETDNDDFAGRVVVDLVRLRPNCSYDVLLPLRESSHVYTKRRRGAVRLRITLSWLSERAMVMSYLPKSSPNTTVSCQGKKAFRAVALCVHGSHMPGKFSMKLLRAIIREVSLTQIHVLRYLRHREIRNLTTWKTPLISAFVFAAWMHSVYWSTARYVPGHAVSFVLLRLWENYLLYAIDEPHHRGFLPPTFEEILGSVLFGRNMIAPLEYSPKASPHIKGLGSGIESLHGDACDTLLERAAAALREVPVKKRRGRRTFSGEDAVELLVTKGLAVNRPQAVQLGRKVAETLGIFGHQTKQTLFCDSSTRFHFVSSQASFGGAETHQPWGKLLRWAFGSSPTRQRTEEMPFAPSSEYPRRPVEESFDMRTKDQKHSHLANDADDEQELGLQSGEDADDVSALVALHNEGSLEYEQTRASKFSRVERLPKPPPQDIDIRTRADKPVSAEFRELRDKAHSYMLHLFEERAYELKMKPGPKRDRVFAAEGTSKVLKRAVSFDDTSKPRSDAKIMQQRRSSLRQVAGAISDIAQDLPNETKRRSWLRESWSDDEFTQDYMLSRSRQRSLSDDRLSSRGRRRSLSDDGSSLQRRRTSSSDGFPSERRQSRSKEGFPRESRRRSWSVRPAKSYSDAEFTKVSLDRLLKIGGSSSSNPWISKIGVLLQPLIEIALAVLSLFRSLHNLFTWRDPVLSFWFSLAGILLVVILHVFPWRMATLAAGVAFVGPQNLILRKLRERRGVLEPDMDTLVHKRKIAKVQQLRAGRPFSLKINKGNDLTAIDQISTRFRHVVVPHSRLMFSHRFYDWPPDPKFSRVHNPSSVANKTVNDTPTQARATSLLAGNAESHWASEFTQLDRSESSSGADPVLTFSLASDEGFGGGVGGFGGGSGGGFRSGGGGNFRGGERGNFSGGTRSRFAQQPVQIRQPVRVVQQPVRVVQQPAQVVQQQDVFRQQQFGYGYGGCSKSKGFCGGKMGGGKMGRSRN